MKHKISRILCTALCCAPLLASAQTSEKSTSPKRLYQEGQTLFQQKAYAAAISPLQAYVRQMNADGKPLPDTGERQEAEYMLVCAAYELRDPKSIDLLRAFLDEYPDTPHANRIYALIAPPISSKAIMTMPSPCSTPPASTFWVPRSVTT